MATISVYMMGGVLKQISTDNDNIRTLRGMVEKIVQEQPHDFNATITMEAITGFTVIPYKSIIYIDAIYDV